MSTLPVEQASKSITYVDGLGRTIQSISKQGSPAKYDLAAPVMYDALGRESKKYLPFAAEQTGLFKPTESIIDGNGDYIGIAATTRYEPNPLNRIVKQGHRVPHGSRMETTRMLPRITPLKNHTS